MRTQADRDDDLRIGRELERKDAEIDRLRAALKQAVEYADVVSLDDGMPEGKQATRLTATWIGKDIRYAAEFDVKAARALCQQNAGDTK